MGASSIQFKKINYPLDLLSVHERNPERYPFLLESVVSGEDVDGNENNRFDILFAFPQQYLRLNQIGVVASDLKNYSTTHFLNALNRWFGSESIDGPDSQITHDLPFRGGWFLYLGYELAQEIEPILSVSQAKLFQPKFSQTKQIQLPVACAVRIPAAIIVDHKKQETWCLVENAYTSCLPKLLNDVNSEEDNIVVNQQALPAVIIEENPERYLRSIETIKRYILDGDVFQVNLSRLWQVRLLEPCGPAALYARLRKSNPAPFSALCCFEGVSIISSSPERLFSVKNKRIETRPIAGTIPRLRNSAGEIDLVADKRLRAELINHPKERAEHVMLIDLARNDLGRIAQIGSVRVSELMVLESYEHVHHIVSNIRADLKPNIYPGDIIAAVFPGGTITGCPKIRCMEIINELEQMPRDAYTGSVGYLNRNGDMDLNILIRTIVQSGEELHIRAGGGIVADSDGSKELLETEAKVKGMLNAIVGTIQ